MLWAFADFCGNLNSGDAHFERDSDDGWFLVLDWIPETLEDLIQREGGFDWSTFPGREEGVIGTTIPQDVGLPDYLNDFVWWSRSWNPSDDQK